MAALAHLKEAIRSGNMEALSAARLQEMRIELNEGMGSDHYTCLHWACHYRKAEVLQHFLDLGGNCGVRSAQGWTSAHVCAIRGCVICLQFLQEAGVDLLARDKRGYTCSHLAAVHGKCGILQVLIRTGLDLQEIDRRKWSVVHHAAFHGRLEILQLLVKLLEILPDVADLEGNTPAHLAAVEGHLDCLRLLVNHKDEPENVIASRNNQGSTPKDLAEQFHKRDCFDFLSLAETEVDSFEYEETGVYKAHTAAKQGRMQLLSMLIKESHCGINDRDTQGSTPAHKAAGHGKWLCLQWLVEHGADVFVRNNRGETPHDVAVRFDKTKCAALLLPSSIAQEDDKKQGEGEDQPLGKSVERAKAKVEHLQEQVMAAKARLREIGGELVEDNEIELLKAEHRRIISSLENNLQLERERRENLEGDMDQLRRQLQHSTQLVQHYEGISSSYSCKGDSTLESTPDLPARLQPCRNKKTARRNRRTSPATTTTGRAFIRLESK